MSTSTLTGDRGQSPVDHPPPPHSTHEPRGSPIDILLIGASNMKRWTNFPKRLRNGYVKNVNLGIPGAQTADFLQPAYLGQVYRYCPQTTIYMAGNNDLREGVHPMHLVQHICRFIAHLQNTYLTCEVRAKIVVCSLIHSMDLQTAKEKRLINGINRQLREFCLSLQSDRVVFVNLNRGLLPEHFMRDGIHFNGAGYKHVYSKLVTHIA
jgi:lysophospholipase L1-like esterase